MNHIFSTICHDVYHQICPTPAVAPANQTSRTAMRPDKLASYLGRDRFF
jgi:hypothetical protein